MRNDMKSKYKETLDLAWSKDKFVLKGKKGTKIYLESRKNHISGMIRVTSKGEYPLNHHDYLVFEIQEKVEPDIMKNVWHHHGIVFTATDYGTEIACHHPQVFSNGILSKLEKHGYIRVTWKEYPKEVREYPLYVNPRGFQWIYNIGSVLFESFHKGVCRLVKRIKDKEV